MDIQSLDLLATRGYSNDAESVAHREELRLKEACQQFEGMLLGMVLKESMRDDGGMAGDEEAGGFGMFKEFCIEQVATSLSETSSMGIADQLYEQMTRFGVRP